MAKRKIYLGGAVYSDWREKLIPHIKKAGMDYVNPVKGNPTKPIMVTRRESSSCDYFFFVLTPNMIPKTDSHWLVDIGECSKKYPTVTLVVVLTNDNDKIFNDDQIRFLSSLEVTLNNNNVMMVASLSQAIDVIRRIGK